MSAQMIEILVLAAIAFLIISKLISMLGVTDEDDPMRSSTSFFGEPGTIKDVTGVSESVEKGKLIKFKNIKALDKTDGKLLEAVLSKIPDFDLDHFLKGAKGAFEMILEALYKKDAKSLEELVDKRFLEELQESSDRYVAGASKDAKLTCVDSYSFGNSVYIKVLFEGKNLKEEWVFTKNVNDKSPAWYLSNISIAE